MTYSKYLHMKEFNIGDWVMINDQICRINGMGENKGPCRPLISYGKK